MDVWDIGTDSDDKGVLSAQDGVITDICEREGSSTNIEIRSRYDGRKLGYWHINRSTLAPGISIGATVYRGQKLGNLLPGTWSDGCGHTENQRDNSAHLDCVIAGTESFTVDGWTIDPPTDSEWRKKGDESVNVLGYLGLTNIRLIRQIKSLWNVLDRQGKGWPYLVRFVDDRVRLVTFNGSEYERRSCEDRWLIVPKGTNVLQFWYEARDGGGQNIPEIKLESHPIGFSIASCAGATEGEYTLPQHESAKFIQPPDNGPPARQAKSSPKPGE